MSLMDCGKVGNWQVNNKKKNKQKVVKGIDK